MSDVIDQETIDRGDKAPYAHLRRAVYSFGTTLFCLTGISLLGALSTGSVAERAVEGMVGIVQIVATTYLTMSTVDRSGLLGHIGERISGGPKNAQPTS